MKKRLLNFHTKGLIEAGCDEAGRGSLVGPVYAAAIILPQNFRHKLLNDSKKMIAAHRDEVRIYIEKKAVAYAVAFASHEEIDSINIMNASFLAMHRAIEKLELSPENLLIDGNQFNPYLNIPHYCIAKGDGKYKSIAAASVLAKIYRDEFMKKLSRDFPQYNWYSNKGYPTVNHRKSITEYGLTYFHRKSFRQLADQRIPKL